MTQLLNESVLVLNKYFLAIQVTNVKVSICEMVTGKALSVDANYKTYSFEEWEDFTKEAKEEEKKEYAGIIRSPSVHLLAPQIIQIPSCEFNNPTIKTIRYSRKNVYERDGYRCQYCKEKVHRNHLTLDHIVPKSKGGLSVWTNIVTACKECNSKKKDKLLHELEWTLLPTPTRPSWKSHIGTPFDKGKKKFWEKFLG